MRKSRLPPRTRSTATIIPNLCSLYSVNAVHSCSPSLSTTFASLIQDLCPPHSKIRALSPAPKKPEQGPDGFKRSGRSYEDGEDPAETPGMAKGIHRIPWNGLPKRGLAEAPDRIKGVHLGTVKQAPRRSGRDTRCGQGGPLDPVRRGQRRSVRSARWDGGPGWSGRTLAQGRIAVGGVRVGSALAESPDGGWRWVHEMPHGERETKWRGPESVSYISQAPRLYLDIIL